MPYYGHTDPREGEAPEPDHDPIHCAACGADTEHDDVMYLPLCDDCLSGCEDSTVVPGGGEQVARERHAGVRR